MAARNSDELPLEVLVDEALAALQPATRKAIVAVPRGQEQYPFAVLRASNYHRSRLAPVAAYYGWARRQSGELVHLWHGRAPALVDPDDWETVAAHVLAIALADLRGWGARKRPLIPAMGELGCLLRR